MWICHAGIRLIIHVVVSRAHIFRRRDAFLFRLQSKSDIAVIFHVENAGVELVVDYDAPAQLDFDVDVFEVEAFDVWPATDGDEHNIVLS